MGRRLMNAGAAAAAAAGGGGGGGGGGAHRLREVVEVDLVEAEEVVRREAAEAAHRADIFWRGSADQIHVTVSTRMRTPSGAPPPPSALLLRFEPRV